MKKNKVIVKNHNRKLEFYLLSENRRFYLFTQKYSKGVYNFFCDGKSENEIRHYKKWDKNPRLDKTIEKLPVYIQYVLLEASWFLSALEVSSQL